MTLVTGAAFNALFADFKQTAFRLEGRDHYYAANEQDRLRGFLAGEPYDVASRLADPWWRMIREATSHGKRVARVRVVTEPHGDYSRYALAGARVNIDGGEDIRYMARHEALELGLPEHDFWLFDAHLLAWMHFDDQGAFLGAELFEQPGTVEQHLRWQETAWQHAIPYDEYIR